MPTYTLPAVATPAPVPPRTAVMIASGDSRPSANAACWSTQRETERAARAAFEALGWSVVRGSPERWSDAEPHGFIFSQAHGREVFAGIDPDAPLVVVESVWQYSMHVLPGLVRHRGPILILANWSGRWPGLVGALNLRGSLTKAGREHGLLWAEDFSDPACRAKLRQWCETGRVEHDLSHVRPLDLARIGVAERELGESLALGLRHRPAILGVFDEGCMGMFNAIIPDHLLHPCGAFKERLSQSALFAAMQRVPEAEARATYGWLLSRGMRFDIGPEAEQLREEQVLEQCRMYIAALRLADRFGCDAIGIQYQLGLAETCAASDLAEGLLNCSERPPVRALEGPNAGAVILEGRPLPHFNEVDECAGLDALITDRVWRAMGMAPDNTLHDVRWSDLDRSGTTAEEVWVFEISGAVPPSHFSRGYADAVGYRQPSMYFVRGGSTICGMSRPGEIVWSRIYVDGIGTRGSPAGAAARGRESVDTRGGGAGRLCMDIGRGTAIALPEAEMLRRWDATTRQWPIMNAVLAGVSRDQLMAKHQSNHIQVVYADGADRADRALDAKAAMANAMGIRVNLCGV
ncbi:MAG TPA: fucose isomerase [Phycisphaerales bacterium]|nr:fucose isomerase [Phycisphaerales bacterium]